MARGCGDPAEGRVVINIPASPYTRPEMFDGDVLVEDRKWYPAAHLGMLRPLLFDVANGGWVVILKVEAIGTPYIGTVRSHNSTP